MSDDRFRDPPPAVKRRPYWDEIPRSYTGPEEIKAFLDWYEREFGIRPPLAAPEFTPMTTAPDPVRPEPHESEEP